MSSDENPILKNAWLTSVKLHSEGTNSWYSNIKFILKNLGMDDDDSDSISNYDLMTKLQDNFINYWRTSLHNDSRQGNYGNKLRTYRKFKTVFSKEKYLDYFKYDKRRILTKFRVSCHSLNIEKGRHNGLKPEERICKTCNSNDIEDEFHFLFVCPKYQDQRDAFFNLLINLVPKSYNDLESCDKFNWLMLCEDRSILNHLTDFIKTCFAIRGI